MLCLHPHNNFYKRYVLKPLMLADIVVLMLKVIIQGRVSWFNHYPFLPANEVTAVIEMLG